MEGRNFTMDSSLESLSNNILDELFTEGAGYDILRYVSLPELLGEDAHTMLYFIGKNLARKFTFESIEDIIKAFYKLGWGHLDLVKERPKSYTFHLMSDAIVYRLKAPFKTEFRMESGFLAAAMQQLERTECECIEKIKNRIHQVELKVILTI